MIARALASRAISTLLLGTIVLDAPLSSQRASTPRVRPRPALTLESYARPDGAITVFADGAYVEPYFAMRALNTAADLGWDVDSLARRYIAWQLKQLGRGTSFKRYCRGDDASWSACGGADADDAALALWIELLYRTAGRMQMPPDWRQSAEASRRALASLWDPVVGVYVVSSALRTGLFMDNIEVLSALETAARSPQAGAGGDRPSLLRGAARLRAAITRVFLGPTHGVVPHLDPACAGAPSFLSGDRRPGFSRRLRLPQSRAILENPCRTMASATRAGLGRPVRQRRGVGAGCGGGPAHGTASGGRLLGRASRTDAFGSVLERRRRSHL